jgi:hypothetical protein
VAAGHVRGLCVEDDANAAGSGDAEPAGR